MSTTVNWSEGLPTDTPIILLRPEQPMQEENRASNGLFIFGTEDLI